MAQGSWLIPQASWLKAHGPENLAMGPPGPGPSAKVSLAMSHEPWALSLETWAVSLEPWTIDNRLSNELLNSKVAKFHFQCFQDSQIRRFHSFKVSELRRFNFAKFQKLNIRGISSIWVGPKSRIIGLGSRSYFALVTQIHKFENMFGF